MIYGLSGIDMCFSLFRELSQENLAIPEVLYVSLVDLGAQIGLIKRTLHVAYNMECEGFQLSGEQLHELMGFQPDTPRFDVEVYEDLIAMLTQCNRKNEVAKPQDMTTGSFRRVINDSINNKLTHF
ncbi:hypothetical protein DVH05_009712 [Phytophthora capsici]|nr:hypothetical protein DVH05_009712 [Phytophthora capsici]